MLDCYWISRLFFGLGEIDVGLFREWNSVMKTEFICANFTNQFSFHKNIVFFEKSHLNFDEWRQEL